MRPFMILIDLFLLLAMSVALASCKDHLLNMAHVRPDGERPPLAIEDFGPDFAEDKTVPVDKDLILGNELVGTEELDGEGASPSSRKRRQTRYCFRFSNMVFTDRYCESLCVAYRYPYRIYSSVLLTCMCCT